MDMVLGYPIKIQDLARNIKVIFMPPNMTSLVQMTDKQMMATFKAFCFGDTMGQ